MQIPGWDAKVTLATDVLLKNSQISAGTKPSTAEVALAAKAFHNFLLCGNAYKPEKTFNGNVCLVKASKLRKRALTLGNDYGVSACVNGKVDVHVAEGSHEEFLLNKGAITCAEIIRSHIKAGSAQ